MNRRDALYHRVLIPFGRITIQGHFVDELIGQIRRRLPATVRYDTVFESVRNLVGVVLTEELAWQTAWRLAGNAHRMAKGQPAPLWAAQQEPEWVPLHAASALLSRNARGRLGYNYKLKILAGSPCPLTTTAFWSREFLSFLAQQVGFSAPWNDYPYSHGTELVHLYFMGRVDPIRSRFEPTFSEFGATPSMIKRNRERVLRVRKRFRAACPYGWGHECYRCVKGYDECPGGTHRLNYVRKLCVTCGNDSHFDYEVNRDKCVMCTKKERLQYEQ